MGPSRMCRHLPSGGPGCSQASCRVFLQHSLHQRPENSRGCVLLDPLFIWLSFLFSELLLPFDGNIFFKSFLRRSEIGHFLRPCILEYLTLTPFLPRVSRHCLLFLLRNQRPFWLLVLCGGIIEIPFLKFHSDAL